MDLVRKLKNPLSIGLISVLSNLGCSSKERRVEYSDLLLQTINIESANDCQGGTITQVRFIPNRENPEIVCISYGQNNFPLIYDLRNSKKYSFLENLSVGDYISIHEITGEIYQYTPKGGIVDNL